jgi:photosystem II stability/assembly factor-like uncharacterized protein
VQAVMAEQTATSNHRRSHQACLKLRAVFVILTAVAGSTGAGVNVWTTLGSLGCAEVLAIDPTDATVIYAACGTSVSKTTDGGATWRIVASLTAGNGINALAVDPRYPWILYAGTLVAGVFKSFDGGESWTAVNVGLAGTALQVWALTIDPRNTATVYLGTAGGGFRTTDGGMSWSALLTPSHERLGWVRAFAFDPRDAATMYVGSGPASANVFKTVDGGATWSRISIWPQHPFVVALAIDPTNPCLSCEVVCASVWNGGAYLSTDGGGHWHSLLGSGLLSLNITAFAVDPTVPFSAYAGTNADGVFRSVNGFSTWASLNAGLGNLAVQSLAIAPGDPRTIYAGTQGGLWSITLVAPTITTTCPLPASTAGVEYSKVLSASGGIPPFTWGVAGGRLPAGLVVCGGPPNFVSAVCGKPEVAGTFDFTLRVTDSALDSSDIACSVTVNPARPVRRHLMRGR